MNGNRTIVNSSSSGVGFLGLLQIVFIVLKLLKVITWSWGLVLIPLWVMLCGIIFIFIFAIVLAIIDSR